MLGLLLAFSVVLAVSPAAAADLPMLKAMCQSCHGERGVNPYPNIPNLAPQHEFYLLKQLRDFKSGRRNDPTMTPVAQLLSASDMESLAKFFAREKP